MDTKKADPATESTLVNAQPNHNTSSKSKKKNAPITSAVINWLISRTTNPKTIAGLRLIDMGVEVESITYVWWGIDIATRGFYESLEVRNGKT